MRLRFSFYLLTLHLIKLCLKFSSDHVGPLQQRLHFSQIFLRLSIILVNIKLPLQILHQEVGLSLTVPFRDNLLLPLSVLIAALLKPLILLLEFIRRSKGIKVSQLQYLTGCMRVLVLLVVVLTALADNHGAIILLLLGWGCPMMILLIFALFMDDFTGFSVTTCRRNFRRVFLQCGHCILSEVKFGEESG